MSSPPRGDFSSSAAAFGSVSPFRGSPFIEEDNPFADLASSRNAAPVPVLRDPSISSPSTISPYFSVRRNVADCSPLVKYIRFTDATATDVIFHDFTSTAETFRLAVDFPHHNTYLTYILSTSAARVSSWSIYYFQIRRFGSSIGSPRSSW